MIFITILRIALNAEFCQKSIKFLLNLDKNLGIFVKKLCESSANRG